MQRRILLIAVVFVAGFGIGYGITWLFVGSPERGQSVEQRRADRERPDAQAVAPEPEVVNAAEPDVAPVAAADTNAAQPEPDTALAVAEVAAPAPSPEPAPAPAPTEVATPRDIDRCLNKMCRIDFGGMAGGISVRKGKLEHGSEVVWERDFGRADKVGTLDADRTVRVEVLGIGLTDGVPSAAYISRKLKRGTQVGVIALKIGERRLSFVPLED